MRTSSLENAMTYDLERAKRLCPPRTIFIGFLTTLVLSAGLFAILQQRHYRRLNAEIVSTGGKLKLPPSVWTIYRNRWHGIGIYEGTSVELDGKSLPRHFLRDRDFLRHLDITDLEIREVTTDTTEFAELVAAHPIGQFRGTRIQGADQIAAALQPKRLVTSIAITKSDLSDEGFATLPLERVTELDVSNTRVTPAGLLHLERCKSGLILWLNGTQLDQEVVDVIGRLPNSVSLTVKDSVSADLLRLFKGSRVRKLWLYNTWLSTEEVEQLQRDLPEIDVSTN